MTRLSQWGARPAFVGIDMQVGILRGCAGANQGAADVALDAMLARVAAVQARNRTDVCHDRRNFICSYRQECNHSCGHRIGGANRRTLSFI